MNIYVPLLPRSLRWAAVVVVAAFIFHVSIITAPPETVVDSAKPGPSTMIPLDKWRHFVAYLAFGITLAFATADLRVKTYVLATAVIGVTVLYGVGIEFGQSFVPERYFSVSDAYANAIGGILITPWYLVRPYLEFVSIQEIVYDLYDG